MHLFTVYSVSKYPIPCVVFIVVPLCMYVCMYLCTWLLYLHVTVVVRYLGSRIETDHLFVDCAAPRTC
jgi:hypothetical protein